MMKNPLGTGRKLNVHKVFRRRLRRLLNVLCTFILRSVSRGNAFYFILKAHFVLKIFKFLSQLFGYVEKTA